MKSIIDKIFLSHMNTDTSPISIKREVYKQLEVHREKYKYVLDDITNDDIDGVKQFENVISKYTDATTKPISELACDTIKDFDKFSPKVKEKAVDLINQVDYSASKLSGANCKPHFTDSEATKLVYENTYKIGNQINNINTRSSGDTDIKSLIENISSNFIKDDIPHLIDINCLYGINSHLTSCVMTHYIIIFAGVPLLLNNYSYIYYSGKELFQNVTTKVYTTFAKPQKVLSFTKTAAFTFFTTGSVYIVLCYNFPNFNNNWYKINVKPLGKMIIYGTDTFFKGVSKWFIKIK